MRHCRGAFPRPVDYRPHPAEPEFPYFDPERYLNPRYKPDRRWSAFPVNNEAGQLRPPDRWTDEAQCGFWCGPVTNHFGHMVAEFGMRLARSSRRAPAMPLVFSIEPLAGSEPPPFFWQIIDHLGIDRARIMLVRRPTRFNCLSVVPQAERPYGGPANPGHLDLMDEIAGRLPAERGDDCVFISRSRQSKGNFAGEAYLDEMFAAAGATVFHPETVDLDTQLRLYRRARQLIFSEGSAMLALQLLGRLDADLVILPRRPGDATRNIAAIAPLRARVRRFSFLPVLRGIVYGLQPDGRPRIAHGISVLDERRLVSELAQFGVDLAKNWDDDAYRQRRDADLADWMARRLANPLHPGEAGCIAACLELALPARSDAVTGRRCESIGHRQPFADRVCVRQLALSGLLPIGGQPLVHQRDGAVDDRVLHPELLSDELHQAVGALDVRHAVVQRPRGR